MHIKNYGNMQLYVIASTPLNACNTQLLGATNTQKGQSKYFALNVKVLFFFALL